MNRTLLITLGLCFAVLGGALWLARHNDRALYAHLPERHECADLSSAAVACATYCLTHPGTRSALTTGTPSMEPFISGGPAWVAYDPAARFADVHPAGEPMLYRAVDGTLIADGHGGWKSAAGVVFLHVSAAKDAGGIIPTGLNTPLYENWGRVTPANYVGKPVAVFVVKQNP